MTKVNATAAFESALTGTAEASVKVRASAAFRSVATIKAAPDGLSADFTSALTCTVSEKIRIRASVAFASELSGAADANVIAPASSPGDPNPANELITDYTITWDQVRRASIAWDGGASNAWWTIFVNGRRAVVLEGSGDMSVNATLDPEINHSIAIIKHNSADDDVVAPHPQRLVRPTVRWCAVSHAAYYEIYEVIGDARYLIHRREAASDQPDVYEHVYASASRHEGLSTLNIQVFARGSFGYSQIPAMVHGFLGGHPAHAASIAAEAGGGLLIRAQ